MRAKILVLEVEEAWQGLQFLADMVAILQVEKRQAYQLKYFIQKPEEYERSIRNWISHNFL